MPDSCKVSEHESHLGELPFMFAPTLPLCSFCAEGRRDAPPPRDDRSDDDDGPDNLHEAFTAKLSAQIADHDHILDRPPASRKSGTALALPSTPPLPPQRWHPADSSSSFEGFHGQGNDAWEIQGGVAVPTRDAPPKRTKHIPGPDAEHDHHAAPEDVALRHWNRPPPGADHGGDRGGVRYGRLDELQGPPVPLHSGHPQATYAAPRPGPRPGSAGGHHPYATGPSGAVARLAREAVDDSDSDETAEQFHRRMARAYAAGAVPGQPRAQSREGPAEHWQHPQQHHYQQQQAQHAYAMGQRGPPPPQGGIWAACSAAPPRPPPHPAAGEYRHYQAGWQELEWHPEEPEQPHSSAERRRGFDHDQSSGPMLRPGSEQPPAHHRNDYHGTLRGYDAGDGWGGGRPGAGPRGPPAPEHSSAEQAPALRTSGGRRDGRDQRASPVTHAHDRPAVSALPEEDELAPHVVDWSTSRRPPPPMPPPLIPPPPPRPPTPLDDKPVGPGVGVAGRARTFEARFPGRKYTRSHNCVSYISCAFLHAHVSAGAARDRAAEGGGARPSGAEPQRRAGAAGGHSGVPSTAILYAFCSAKRLSLRRASAAGVGAPPVPAQRGEIVSAESG